MTEVRRFETLASGKLEWPDWGRLLHARDV
jgi:hypothetical protein